MKVKSSGAGGNVTEISNTRVRLQVTKEEGKIQRRAVAGCCSAVGGICRELLDHRSTPLYLDPEEAHSQMRSTEVVSFLGRHGARVVHPRNCGRSGSQSLQTLQLTRRYCNDGVTP